MDNNRKFDELTNSIRHFERVIRTVMTVQDHQGNRVRLGIRVGMVFLGLFAVSIFILLYTVSTKMNDVALAIEEMNHTFEVVTNRMHRIDNIMVSLEQNVAYLPSIGTTMPTMETDIEQLTNTVKMMRDELDAMAIDMTAIKQQSVTMGETSQQMAHGIQRMSGEMNHMSQPARSINRFIPFP